MVIDRPVARSLVWALAAAGAVLLALNPAWAQTEGKAVGKVVPLHAPRKHDSGGARRRRDPIREEGADGDADLCECICGKRAQLLQLPPGCGSEGVCISLGGSLGRGILAYIWWLSKDVPTGVAVRGRGFAHVKVDRPADPNRGEAIYARTCAVCHGADGQGRQGPNGEYLFPALWGPKSFNIGAGMVRLSNAAGFVKTNMPLGQGNTLSDGDALDVAAYFTRQPRPDFAAKSRDWPKGGKPSDAPY